MLNIYKLKKKIVLPKLNNKPEDLCGKIKDTVPANKEWFNSIYTFNKNSIKILPITTNIVYKIMKSYFNMFYNKIEKTKSRRKDIMARKWSSRKIWISRPEIKHSNNKLTITLYIYNRQYNYFANKLHKIKNTWSRGSNYSTNFLYLQYKIKKLISVINLFNNNILNNITEKYKQSFLWKNLINKYKNIEPKDPLFIKYILYILNVEITYLRFKQIMLFNKFKFNTYIVGIKQVIQKVLKKNVEFNLISIKNFHLSSSILSQIITRKIRKKRNNPLRVLKTSLRKIKTPILNEKTIKRENNKLTEVQNVLMRDLIKLNKNNFLAKNPKISDNIRLEDFILSNTRYKLVGGITLKASGRITKRIIAERARYKIRSVGTLKNINSSYKGLSSAMVRGYKKSNIDNTLLSSKTHVGAFGLKGWISSY